MSKTVSWCLLITAFAVVCVMSSATPRVLGDGNEFLLNFVTGELLDVLGVILAITLAASGQLHLTLNQIEEKKKRAGFHRTRRSVRQATYTLVVLFVAAVILVVAKPVLASETWSQSLFNGVALVILFWNVLLLVSLTAGIFAIKPEIEDESSNTTT